MRAAGGSVMSMMASPAEPSATAMRLPEQVTAVAAGTVTAIADDALWGRVVEVTDAQDRVWRYCGLEEVAVTQREKVTAGTRLGTTGNVPAEAQQGSHLHLECRKAGACLDPEKN